MTDRTRDTDVVVVGAGMAGLVAAVEALDRDLDVLVLEKGTRAGGSMALSAGNVFTYDSYEAAREAVPHGDAGLQRMVVTNHEEGLEWLADLGASLREPDEVLPFGSGKTLDPGPFTDLMVDTIEDRGGAVRLETPLVDLIESDGRVVGVRAGREAVEPITAGAVILATGGFQGNEALMKEYVTDTPEHVWLRANPWSTGDGFLSARDIGANVSGGMGTFFGKAFPAAPAEIEPTDFFEAKQHYGPAAIAVGSDGRRFTDESAGTLIQDMTTAPDGMCYYLLDEGLYESSVEGKHVGTAITTARALGGPVASAKSLDALASRLFEWGVNGTVAVDTIESFNEAVTADRAGELDPPRRSNRRTVDSPPFYAVAVQPAIVETFGGLAVSMDMGVLRRAASPTSLRYYPDHPSEARAGSIPGLFAAGADVGNVMHTHFMGGLAVALTTGRIAGRTAAASI